MKAKDLRERSVEDLRELEKSLTRDTFAARFKNFTNRLDDTSSIGKARQDLARVKTILRQLELNAEAKGEKLAKGASVASEMKADGIAPALKAQKAAKAANKKAKTSRKSTAKTPKAAKAEKSK